MNFRAPLAAALALVALLPVSGGALAHGTRAPQKMETIKVSLSVTHAIPSHTTLWLVYGPPAATFGIVQMRHTTRSLYVASLRLPVGSKATFSYLAGHGTVQTPGGAAPGNPVVTIRQLPPIVISARPLPVVRWAGPAR
jgi:hypothetical protein